MDSKIKCPLTDEIIEDISCIEVRDVVDDIIAESFITNEYKSKENWKDICKKCKFHNI